MFFAILCLIISLVFIFLLNKADENNPNGLSVNVLQKSLLKIHLWLLKNELFSFFIFAYPRIKGNLSLFQKQSKIEKLVWSRLIIVSTIAILIELISMVNVTTWLPSNISAILRGIIIIYIFLLQFTLLLSLLRPLFGVKIDEDGISLNQDIAEDTVPSIPSPRRSLFMALINFAEIIISWGIIYRCLIPNIITTMDQANYFSVVTFTTLGYGEINAGVSLVLQLAISLNMLVFLLFTVCHVTTIMGSMSRNPK